MKSIDIKKEFQEWQKENYEAPVYEYLNWMKKLESCAEKKTSLSPRSDLFLF